jgi:putative FmdB family regulatory protein
MPIYEYRCHSCRKRFSVLYRSFNVAGPVACRYCGAIGVERLVSKVAVLRSEESRLESLDDNSALAGVDENDPKSVARWARKMGGELGEEAGPEWDEMVDRLEQGEMPDADPGDDFSADAGDDL